MNLFDLMIKITTDTSGLEKGIGVAKRGMSGLTKTLGGGVAKAAKVGMAAIGTATAAVGAFAASSVKVGMGFDASMSQVAATMGKTVDEIGELRDFAQEMGRTTAFSATQAADALNYMALAGYDAQTSMDMLPNVLNLAAAGSMDLARASDMITDTQTAFGISLERTSQMVDEMAKAASTGNTSVEQLGDAFLTVGGLAQELNGGFVELSDGTKAEVDGVQELEIALTAMANAGIKGSEAGTHMRNMLMKLSSPTSEGTARLEAMGVAVFDDEQKMRSLSDIFGDLSKEMDNMTQQEKIQAISDLFNTRDLASAEAILNAVGEDWDEIGASILDAEGAASKMAETQLDNLSGDITLFKSALEGAQIAVSDGLVPSLRDFVQFGTSGISRVTEALTKAGPTSAIRIMGETISDGINMIMGKLPSFVNSGMKMLEAVGKGIMQNAPAMIDAGLEVVNMLATGFLESLPKVVEAGVSIILSLLSGITSMLPELMSMASDSLSQIIDSILSNLDEFIELAVTIIEALVEGIAENLPLLLDAALQIITALANGLAEMLPEMIPTIVQIVLSIYETLINNIDVLVDAALQIILALADGLIQALPMLLEKAPIIMQNLYDTLAANFPKILEAGVQLLGMLAQGVLNNMPAIISGFISVMTTALSTILKHLPQFLQKGIELVGQLVAGLIRAIPQVIAAIPQIIQSIKSPFDSFDWASIGINLIKGIASGVANAAVNLASAALDAVKSTFSTVTGWLGIHSPSTRARDVIGKRISEGIEVGFVKDMKRASKSMVDSMSDAFDEMDEELSPTLGIADDSGYTVIDTDDGAVSGGTFAPVINVYGSEGQDVNELANIVMDKLSLAYRRKKVSYAY